jgi:hypothetical protein
MYIYTTHLASANVFIDEVANDSKSMYIITLQSVSGEANINCKYLLQILLIINSIIRY